MAAADAETTGGAVKASDFDYLLGMPLWNLSQENVDKMREELRQKGGELQGVQSTSIEEMWDGELNSLRNQIEAEWDAQAKEENEAAKLRAKSSVVDVGAGGGKKTGKKGNKKADDDCEDNGKTFYEFHKELDEMRKRKFKGTKLNFDAKMTITVDLEKKREYVASRVVGDRREKKSTTAF